MFELYRCNDTTGDCGLLPQRPSSNRREAWLVPGTWGLYDQGRQLVPTPPIFADPIRSLSTAVKH